MGVAVAKKREKAEQGKVELRALQTWIDRVEEEAARLGLSRSAYIRSVVTREMDRTAAERQKNTRED